MCISVRDSRNNCNSKSRNCGQEGEKSTCTDFSWLDHFLTLSSDTSQQNDWPNIREFGVEVRNAKWAIYEYIYVYTSIVIVLSESECVCVFNIGFDLQSLTDPFCVVIQVLTLLYRYCSEFKINSGQIPLLDDNAECATFHHCYAYNYFFCLSEFLIAK